MSHDSRDPAESRDALRADCSQCAGLCCVAPPFTASADFAFDKPAGQPCRNLLEDFRCGIHTRLRDRGFPGCTVFDCYGAGQRTTQQTFGGGDWRRDQGTAREMFAVFAVQRRLHELLWYLAEARSLLPEGTELRREVVALAEHIEERVGGTPTEVAATDAGALREETGGVLERVSRLLRTGVARKGTRAQGHRGAELIEADLRNTPLRGASLRGSLLLGADLRGADLYRTDLLGADLRAADLRGADLRAALFVTGPQLAAARGDAGTRVPEALSRPDHWATTREAVPTGPGGGSARKARRQRRARGRAGGNGRR